MSCIVLFRPNAHRIVMAADSASTTAEPTSLAPRMVVRRLECSLYGGTLPGVLGDGREPFYFTTGQQAAGHREQSPGMAAARRF